MSHRLALTSKISDGVNSRCEASGLPTQSATSLPGVLWTLGFLDILASWRRPQA